MAFLAYRWLGTAASGDVEINFDVEINLKRTGNG
jgi:hypothetical protein